MGALGDAFRNFKKNMYEQRAKREAEEAALRARMKNYCRGYDIFPDEINSRYTSYVCRKLMKDLLIKGFLIAGFVLFAFFTWKMLGLFLVFLGFIFLFVLLAALVNLSDLLHFLHGEYDSFGAMVTNKRTESHTTTDSEGQTTTSYDYYVSLNGIECEVSGKESGKVTVGQYCHFVRLRAKYRRNDKFFFFPCPDTEEQFIIGQHSPGRELRLYRREKGSTGVSLLAILCFVGSVLMSGYIVAAKRLEEPKLWLLCGSLLAVSILLAVINKIIAASKERKKLEEIRNANNYRE